MVRAFDETMPNPGEFSMYLGSGDQQKAQYSQKTVQKRREFEAHP